MERRELLQKTGGVLFGTTALATGLASAKHPKGLMYYEDYSGDVADWDFEHVKTIGKYNPLGRNKYVYRLTLEFEDHADGEVVAQMGEDGGQDAHSLEWYADPNGGGSRTFETFDFIDSLFIHSKGLAE